MIKPDKITFTNILWGLLAIICYWTNLCTKTNPFQSAGNHQKNNNVNQGFYGLFSLPLYETKWPADNENGVLWQRTNAKSSLPSTLKSVIHEILRIHLQHAHNQ